MLHSELGILHFWSYIGSPASDTIQLQHIEQLSFLAVGSDLPSAQKYRHNQRCIEENISSLSRKSIIQAVTISHLKIKPSFVLSSRSSAQSDMSYAAFPPEICPFVFLQNAYCQPFPTNLCIMASFCIKQIFPLLLRPQQPSNSHSQSHWSFPVKPNRTFSLFRCQKMQEDAPKAGSIKSFFKW